MALEVHCEALPAGVTVLRVRGRITLGLDTRRLETTIAELEQAGIERLVLDLSGVDYMDSAGLGVLTRCSVAMQRNGGVFRIAGANAKIRQLLKVTRLDTMIPSFPTVEDACASSGAGAA